MMRSMLHVTHPRAFVVALIIPQLAGVIGSFFTFPAISEWYQGLQMPLLAPPNWVFGPVWTTLFLLMGVALYLVWKAGASRREVHLALSVFGVQLVLNSLWSILFFGMRNPGVAFAEILILWLMIVATIVTFWRVARVAAWLLVPYLAWVSFAAYLNFMIWQLN